jgi:OOP family OmpA-OmpF porin
MNRTPRTLLALVACAGFVACGSTPKPVVVVAETPAAPPPPADPPPPPPKLAATCDATLENDGKLHFPHEVEFEVAKSTLKDTDTTNKILQCLADFMANNKMVTKFRLEGFTDSQGDKAMNQTLSDARANAVLTWLTAHGTDGARLWAKGYGPEHPIAKNDTPEHMAMNRRVEFHVDEINGTKATPDAIQLAMNPPVPVAPATPAPAAGVTVAVTAPAVKVTAPSVSVTAAAPGVSAAAAAPGVSVTAAAPSVGVSASAPGVSAGVSTGSKPKK